MPTEVAATPVILATLGAHGTPDGIVSEMAISIMWTARVLYHVRGRPIISASGRVDINKEKNEQTNKRTNFCAYSCDHFLVAQLLVSFFPPSYGRA